MPRVSVVIPTYRQWSSLQTCLDALAKQSIPPENFEILVVNNDPEDTPPADFRMPSNATLLSETAKGSYAARNRGLAEGSGEILCFTDADCIPEPDWIQASVAALEASSNTMRVGGRIGVALDAEATELARLHDTAFAFGQRKYVTTKGWAATANMTARRKVFDAIGPFDASLMSGGDKEWGRRAQAKGFPIVYCENGAVLHPPRASVAQIASKVRRVTGGKITQKLKSKGLFRLRVEYLLRTPLRLLPRVSAIRRVLSVKGLKPRDRVRLFVLLNYLKLVEWRERGRLLFLNSPPERR